MSELSEAVVLFLLFSMLVILIVSGAIVAYVAFPHRGQRLPGIPWLGNALTKAIERMPTLDEAEQDALVAQQRARERERRTLV